VRFTEFRYITNIKEREMENYTYQEVPGNKLKAANHDESNSLLVDIEESYVQQM
jgi:hypothetical protein